MRIAQLVCVYPPYGGGMGYVASRLSRALAAEHQVTVFTPRYHKGQTFAKQPGVSVEAVKPWFSFGNAAYLPQLAKRLKDFDVVHLHYPFFGVQELLPKLPAKVKLVITYHMAPQAPGLKGMAFHFLTRLYDKPLAERASLLLVSTRDYLKTVALPHFGEPNKWQVLPFGVEEGFGPGPKPEQLGRELKLRPNVPVILFVSALDKAHAFKGLPVLLDSLSRLNSRPWQLLVVGGGNLQSAFAARAKQMGLADRVRFAGSVSEAAMPQYYRLSDIFVLPSLNAAEAFGLVIVQAMMSGLPVVTSRLPGVREVVREGETGLLTMPGHAASLAAALDTLLEHRALARELGVRGREVAQQEYSWEVIGQKLCGFYRALL